MRETAYRLAGEWRAPQLPKPDIPFVVTYVRFESGLHEYYRSVIPGMWLRQSGLCDVILQDEAPLEDRMNAAQVVVISRPNAPWEVDSIRELKSSGRLVVIDTDDYPEGLHELGETAKRVWTEEKTADYERCVLLADLVTVSTPPLAERMRELGVEKIALIENALDPHSDRWDVLWPEDDGKVRIGWVAGFTHQHDAELLEKPIKEILKRYPQAVFVTVGYMPSWVADLDYGQLEVRQTAQILNLSKITVGIDIALGPLSTLPYNQYRSQVKFQEATCAGSCFVASNTGAYKRELRHRDTAYLCETDQDWIDALSFLMDVRRREKLYSRAHRDLMKMSIYSKLPEIYGIYRKALRDKLEGIRRRILCQS